MKEIIVDPNSPASTSPVSQGTKGGGFVFVGGQMPRDMETGEIVAGADAQPMVTARAPAAVRASAIDSVSDPSARRKTCSQGIGVSGLEDISQSARTMVEC